MTMTYRTDWTRWWITTQQGKRQYSLMTTSKLKCLVSGLALKRLKKIFICGRSRRHFYWLHEKSIMVREVRSWNPAICRMSQCRRARKSSHGCRTMTDHHGHSSVGRLDRFKTSLLACFACLLILTVHTGRVLVVLHVYVLLASLDATTPPSLLDSIQRSQMANSIS
jgi:hypothetical protein